jgi:hypothetical protein
MISERRQIAERSLSEGNGEAARIRGNRVRDLNKIQSEAYMGWTPPHTGSMRRRRESDAVVPDYYARFPKPCVGGWGRRSLNVTPAGRVLPCHAAESIPGLEFWSSLSSRGGRLCPCPAVCS